MEVHMRMAEMNMMLSKMMMTSMEAKIEIQMMPMKMITSKV